MRTVPALRAMLTAAAVIAAVAGCGANVDGDTRTESTATTNSTTDALFNPCSDLPDNVLTQVGLDPSSKSVTTDPPSGPSAWRVCSWKPEHKQYEIAIFSTIHTVEESRARDDLVDFRDVTIGPRPGLTFHDDFDHDKSTCHAVFPAEQGMFDVSANWTFESSRDQNICDVATEYAVALEPHLPE